MNIEKEIIDINNKVKSAENILEDIRIQQEDLKMQQALLDRKTHLFKVISFVNEIEKLINEGVFKDYNIAYIKANIKMFYNGDDSGYKVNFIFLDSNQKEKRVFFKPGNLSFHKVANNLTEKLGILKLENINDCFADGSFKTIPINNSSELYNILLCNELKITLDYTNMKLSLPSNDSVSNKKPKL